jgi:hypothetical protein
VTGGYGRRRLPQPLIVEFVANQLHIRQPAGRINAEGVMLAALPAEIAFAVAAVSGARGEIDDVGEVTETRGADTAGEGMTICR